MHYAPRSSTCIFTFIFVNIQQASINTLGCNVLVYRWKNSIEHLSFIRTHFHIRHHFARLFSATTTKKRITRSYHYYYHTVDIYLWGRGPTLWPCGVKLAVTMKYWFICLHFWPLSIYIIIIYRCRVVEVPWLVSRQAVNSLELLDHSTFVKVCNEKNSDVKPAAWKCPLVTTDSFCGVYMLFWLRMWNSFSATLSRTLKKHKHFLTW